jgi:sugar phosphate isomerase/epimerase
VPRDEIAANYAGLTDLARPTGVSAVLEFWGRAKQLNCIRDAREVLGGAGVPEGSILLDLFHMYTGGSTIADMEGMRSREVGLVHINDYPSVPAREVITDAERVMPGDGAGPVSGFLSALNEIGYRGFLSVELFRSDYGKASAREVAAIAREKTISCWSTAAGS